MKNKVWAFQPYDMDGNLADAYNRHCELVPNSEDWIILIDADFMFLTPKYEHVIAEYLEKYPEYKLWTCYTGRVKCKPQLQKDMFYEMDMREHRKRALELYENKKYEVKPIKRVISGYCMIFQKKTWEEVGGFNGIGMFGVDTRFSRRILKMGGNIGLMEAVYGMHYYRALEGTNAEPYKDHKMNEELKKKSNFYEKWR